MMCACEDFIVIVVFMITTITKVLGGSPGAESAGEVEILKTDVLGRVRVPEGKREVILDVFERSGLSGQAFAAKWGLKYPTFATWLQKRRRARAEYPKVKKASVAKAFSLVEALVGEDAAKEGASLEVEAPGGIKLRLSRREDIALLVELLRALRASGVC